MGKGVAFLLSAVLLVLTGVVADCSRVGHSGDTPVRAVSTLKR